MSYLERRVAVDIEVWRASGEAGRQRILPDGCLDLILEGDRLLVAGPDTVARVHERRAGVVHGVRLHAGRGPALLGVPADELSDRVLPLEQVWGDRRARALRSRLHDPTDPWSALGRWAVAAEPDPFGLRLRTLLASGRPVVAAAERLGYSTRQLRRRAMATFGYGPQHLARILRLLDAVVAADAGGAWADVAARSGYADQAHLAREVKALTGTTPTALRRERGVTVMADGSKTAASWVA